jgi:ATP-dependent RNA helicase DDX23/PRP28
MTQRDWRIFREDFSISTKGGNMPHPIRYWSEAGLPQKMLDVIAAVGYTEPTPIQRQAISIQIQNRDIIGVAQTGSGKTASFVIPMLVFISMLPPLTYENAAQGPYALIMAPTRELAQQIEQEAAKFAGAMGYICVSLVGGHTIQEQATNLRNGAHIVIATPGRLKDCIDRRIVSLSQCTYIVMDEADRMMEMGCEDDLQFILDAMPLSNLKPDTDDAENVERLKLMTKRALPYRQTVMFSATMPAEVERLAKAYLRRPATVVIGIAGQVVDTIEQRVEFIHEEPRKISRLQSILSSKEFKSPIIIFVNRKTTCETVSKALGNLGVYMRLTQFRCITLHGSKSQQQREAALSSITT